jgi:hypothetical protein
MKSDKHLEILGQQSNKSTLVLKAVESVVHYTAIPKHK